MNFRKKDGLHLVGREKNKVLKKILLTLALVLSLASHGQIRMSKRMQYSQMAYPNDKQLFFVEFWASWCEPCIHVSKYLNVVQEKYRSELYIISITKESQDVVDKFLKKHTTKMAVGLDYDGENFSRFAVNALPYGILINGKGDIVWRGNPSDLKVQQIDEFLKKYKEKTPINEFFVYQPYQRQEEKKYLFDGDFSLTEEKGEVGSLLEVENSTQDVETLKGSLGQIVAYLMGVGGMQVEEAHLKKGLFYNLLIKQNAPKREIAQRILKSKGLRLEVGQKWGKRIRVEEVDRTKFWDTKQILWGEKTPKTLVDDSQIMADDMELEQMLWVVAQAKQLPIDCSGCKGGEKNDWQIQYMYEDLMKANMLDYGIRISVENGSYPYFRIKDEK